MRIRHVAALALALLLSACAQQPIQPPPPPQPKPVKIGLALGGGAARGFAHIGVIKVLEANGIKPDFIVGTSAGAVVGSLYASGLNGFQLQNMALQIKEDELTDWALPNRGVLKGEALQDFINKAVSNKPIEKLARPFGAVATDLDTGELVVFRRGNTGMAVRASSTVPGVFQPTIINGHEYVDGGLTSPVPIQAARDMGADFVIAVDISQTPRRGKVGGTMSELLQTFTIMGNAIKRHELGEADVVIRPQTANVGASDFDDRHLA
ncbi:MAG: patatin-like phospholipase family protein, partial [Parasulfuritortus sp.]|nr:patatin-like phospholipase family protein [Parasulfuritortus sp.]